ncbi:MAG TPA: DUF1992 domain-containing protein [Nocardioidaceae bacterium]|nr:DUF1992 domain-containing protein [Nocardioidaceae bacterium]
MADRRSGQRRKSEVELAIEEERRLRRARVAAVTGQVPEPEPDVDKDEDEDDDAPAQRMEQQALWVDMQVRRAMERGDFDNLPGAGKPIKGLGPTHDPDWWVKSLIEREKITGVLPPALALRKEDAELESVLDRETTEEGVRRTVADFNRRVVEARRQLTGGPPVVTPTRDEDAEVAQWRARRAARREQQRRQLESPAPASVVRPRRRWWHRNR